MSDEKETPSRFGTLVGWGTLLTGIAAIVGLWINFHPSISSPDSNSTRNEPSDTKSPNPTHVEPDPTRQIQQCPS